MIKHISNLLGDFSPSEHHQSQLGVLSPRYGNTKCSKPPTRNIMRFRMVTMLDNKIVGLVQKIPATAQSMPQVTR